MNQANRIREYVNTTRIEPARTAGQTQIQVRAGDIHTEMGLHDGMPAVASAIGAKLFEKTHGVRCVARTGPHQGANLTFTFEV